MPVVEAGGSISMVVAVWTVSAGSGAGKYKVAATVAGRPVESELEATVVQGMVASAAPAAAAAARAAMPPPATDAGLDIKASTSRCAAPDRSPSGTRAVGPTREDSTVRV